MLQQFDSDQYALSEHLLVKYVVAGVLLLCLIYAGLRLLNSVVEDTEQVAIEMKQERLEQALSFVHQHWNQRGQPPKLTLTFQYQNNVVRDYIVHVNKFGWPVNVGQNNQQLHCENIWRYLVLDQQVEKAKLNNVQIVQTRHTCQFEQGYGKNKQWHIVYNTENGRLLNN